MSSILKTFSNNLANASVVRKFLRNESGAIAIEFAFVLPVLVSLFLGFSVAAKGQQLSADVGRTSAVVSDIIAQSDKLKKAEIDAALIAGEAIAGATDGTSIKIGVFGVEISDSGSTKVIWARGVNGAVLPTVNASYNLPASLIVPNEEGFVVVSEAELYYTPPVGQTIFDPFKLDAKNYFVPRIGDAMKCTDC